MATAEKDIPVYPALGPIATAFPPMFEFPALTPIATDPAF